MEPLEDADLQSVYFWVDSIPLSRPKRNIARDFSDGVLLAEVVHHYFPKMVELHNYSSANSIRQKLYNWATLNQKVLRRLSFEVKKHEIEAIVNCKPGVIEAILFQLQTKIAEYRARKAAGELSPGRGSAGSVGSRDAEDDGPVRGAATMVGSFGAAAAAAKAASAGGAAAGAGAGSSMDAALLAEKDTTIAELRETVEILELKIKKLEQLVKLKDSRLATLQSRLQSTAGVPAAAPGSQ